MFDMLEYVEKSLFGTPVKSVRREKPCHHCWQPKPLDHLDSRQLCPECRRKDLHRCAECGFYFEADQMDGYVCRDCAEAHPGESRCEQCGEWYEGDFKICDDCYYHGGADCMDIAHGWAEQAMIG